MIEKMISKVNQYLPLKICGVEWDTAQFLLNGPGWNFASLCAWRITFKNHIVLGSYDPDSEQKIAKLKNLEIIEIIYQENLLKVDPVFILSNEQRIEFFSTDTFEPWTFGIENVFFYNATRSEPQL